MEFVVLVPQFAPEHIKWLGFEPFNGTRQAFFRQLQRPELNCALAGALEPHDFSVN
ncbi:hypothetical protein [Streptomyces afghaniensis]|uniref:hypothetical protein n=1 Tax=Streptomyces afghaniensis TaxID=66865 RepID=UPI0027D8FC11|nr:hypothetical protein [Streptomyces afghaniensis]